MTQDNGSQPVTGPEDQPQAHHSVDMTQDDPTLVEGRRICVAARVDGERCGSNPPRDKLLCNAHAGTLDPSAGGHALARKKREARSRAESEAAVRALGTRAVVAQVFARRAAAVEKTVDLLLDAAESGDVRSAQALLPWIDQALGKPTERVEQHAPSSREDLERLDTRALEALVARGRDRLKAVGE